MALCSHGALKDRLAAAYSDHLADIDAQELPLETQQDFVEFSKVMHAARVLPGDHVVRASVRKLSNEQVQLYATLIVRIYGIELQNQNQNASLRAPARIAAPARGNTTALGALLALEGGSGGRNKHASGA